LIGLTKRHAATRSKNHERGCAAPILN
jgi:hypothetical protein